MENVRPQLLYLIATHMVNRKKMLLGTGCLESESLNTYISGHAGVLECLGTGAEEASNPNIMEFSIKR